MFGMLAASSNNPKWRINQLIDMLYVHTIEESNKGNIYKRSFVWLKLFPIHIH